jgi:hypothetical protein
MFVEQLDDCIALHALGTIFLLWCLNIKNEKGSYLYIKVCSYSSSVIEGQVINLFFPLLGVGCQIWQEFHFYEMFPVCFICFLWYNGGKKKKISKKLFSWLSSCLAHPCVGPFFWGNLCPWLRALPYTHTCKILSTLKE